MDQKKTESLVQRAREALQRSGVSDFVEIDDPGPGDTTCLIEVEGGSVWVKAWVLVEAENG